MNNNSGCTDRMSALEDDKCSSEVAEVMPLLTASHQSAKTIKSLRQLSCRVESVSFTTITESPSSPATSPSLSKMQSQSAPVSAVNSLLVPSHSKAGIRPREHSVQAVPGGDSLEEEEEDGGHQNGTLPSCLPICQPLITVTINPLEKDEITFVPPSPMTEQRGWTLMDDEERKLSIGSASSFDEEDDMNTLTLGSRDIRRVSDISHINQLRREISGLSHLASEYYEVKTTSDPDNISLDSIHVRVLSRCAKYQVREKKSDRSSRCFVIITTSLTIIGISCGFWYKNFSGLAAEENH